MNQPASRRRVRARRSGGVFAAVGLALLLLLAALGGCTTEHPGVSPHPGLLHYPAGIAAHPGGRYIYVANSNFDLSFTGGTVMVISTDETKTGEVTVNGIKQQMKLLKVLSESTVSIGSFAGQATISADGKRLYVISRQDRKKGGAEDLSSLTVLALKDTGGPTGLLSCHEEAIAPSQSGGVGREGVTEPDPPSRCGDDSKLFLPADRVPFAIIRASFQLAQADSTKLKQTERLVVSHLGKGGLSMFDLLARVDPTTGKKLSTELKQVVGEVTGLPEGIAAIAAGPLGDVFAVSRAYDKVYTLPRSVVEGQNVGTGSERFYNSEITESVYADLRGVAFLAGSTPDTGRLFVASRIPEALLVYDVSREPTTGLLQMVQTALMPVGRGPSQLLIRQNSGGNPLLYVTCSKANMLQVFDTSTLRPVARVKLSNHPYFMTILERAAVAPGRVGPRAYVVNFIDSSVSVVDLTTHTEIGRVAGYPTYRAGG